ncbi:DNA-binding NtrC family response regulator [Thermosporothrix hazakensis]|jgi:DNA-binding NtrC family response regulator|uniref:DNA-binding NtrC family response regulator n=2 Tax=Thermosporothrix TaxID=768650 RepID=A0A326U9B2_THEHA|nr:response regulator [Thermosporothrix hazakensis]PZW32007.1 DNA-binding NtrC family response regulator [Thermosporothrix hazakensis]BBH91521.1 transcriptional regulatory protein ZraR [Thermosporothrix sp. COM3]GCE49667.1 transcriptional regulatory protein ZraR [Thermosporothrix hazakensis]
MSEYVLIVDDEANMRWILSEALRTTGFEPESVASGQEALAKMAERTYQLVLLDLKLKGMDGLATLRKLRERWPEVVVLMLTAYGTVASAVEAMQLGAADYLRKPFDIEELHFKIQRALERKALQTEVHHLRNLRKTTQEPVGSHPRWLQAVEQIRSLTRLTPDLLFLGEQGSGKAHLARWSHQLSTRFEAPIVELDLQHLAEAQLQQLLQGGRMLVGAGTLLLRHAHTLAEPALEALIRLFPATEPATRPRLLLTSERPLALFQHLPTIPVPPLRDHREDIPLLVQHFTRQPFTQTAFQVLEHYAWPGNIAELRLVVERAAVLAQGALITEGHLPERVRQAPPADQPIRLPLEGLNLEAVEISLIRQALERTGGNKTRAAELLGLTRHTLLYRIEKYHLED